jgi:hypothetical protein
MRQHLTYAVYSQCANPNDHSGPCGPPSNVVGIVIYAALAVVVVGYVAFWIWMHQSRGEHPHSLAGRAVGRLYGAAIGRATKR